MPDIESVWARIKTHEGDTFYTKTGGEFTYEISGQSLRPSRTERNLGKKNFAEALPLVPINGPGEINDLVQGPAYVWAILHDKRIRQNEW